MIIFVLAALALIGGATFCALDVPTSDHPQRTERFAVLLLLASMFLLAMGGLAALVTPQQ
jgi:hypothetical protein